jgi:Dyp-type peroxidase family
MFIPSMERTIDDINHPDLVPFLTDLQGNILKSHGRNHVAVLLLNFGPSDATAQPMKARAWIRDISSAASNRLTSAHEQNQQSSSVRNGTDTFQTLALSSRGYEFLSTKRPSDGAFRDGMQRRGPLLRDPAVASWEAKYRAAPDDIHALLQIANKDIAPIDAEIARVKTELAAFGGQILIEERGNQLRDNSPDKEPIEHFGYRDGVSQPLFIRDLTQPQKPEFDQHSPLKLVLVRDPSGPERFGSYLVYRKLEQNPRKFDEGVKAVTEIEGMDMSEVLAGAMTVGRFKDGTPVVLRDVAMGNDGDKKDFNYDDDEDGQKCPFAAHVRKVNPRGELPFFVNIFAREQTRRIARRGITYGDRPDLKTPGALPPTGGVGLLFMCYQNDIADQFEFIQETWANNRNFRKSEVGIDPVIGQSRNHPDRDPEELPRWPVAWGSGTKKHVPNGGYVTLRGGEYFFAPSLATLRNMGA